MITLSLSRFWTEVFGPHCHNCGRYGYSDDTPYYFLIKGIGKHDSKTWCLHCIRKIP